METIDIDGKIYSIQQLKIMIDFYNIHHKISNADLKELLSQYNITDDDIKGSGKHGSVLKSDRYRAYEKLPKQELTYNIQNDHKSLTGIEDVDLLLLKTLPSNKLHQMNINQYNKSLIDKICNDKLKALNITHYDTAYKIALREGNKEVIKTLLECRKVKPLMPDKLDIELPYALSTLYELQEHKNKSLQKFAKKFEYKPIAPIIYTGEKLTIHLNRKDDDGPTITMNTEGGVSAAEILYYIAQNLPDDMSDVYGDHVYWEGIYKKNGIYYLKLGS